MVLVFERLILLSFSLHMLHSRIHAIGLHNEMIIQKYNYQLSPKCSKYKYER